MAFLVVLSLFFVMLLDHVKFWSRDNPGYFTCLTGIFILLMLTVGQLLRFVVKISSTDFVSFISPFVKTNLSGRSRRCYFY